MPRKDSFFKGNFDSSSQSSSILAYFRNLFYSFRPRKYQQALSSDDFNSITYLSQTLFFAVLVLFVITLMVLFIKPSLINYQERMSIELVSSAGINLNEENATLTSEKRSPIVSFTYEGGLFYHKPLICLLVKSYCLFKEPTSVPYGETTLLPNDVQSESLYVVLLILPSLFILYYVFNFIKYIIIIMLIAAVTYVITRSSSVEIPGKFIFTSAFYACPLLIFLDLWIMPFVNLYIMPLIIYLLFYILILRNFYNKYV